MKDSRTKNSIRNVRTGLIVQIVNKLMSFIVRTVFIKALNSEYLGVNGLYTNILTVLSFAELGIGTAIIFNMYKPVADGDKEKIKSLMKLYKKAYNCIGVIVFVLGLCVIPFMNLIIKNAPNIKENLILIYILFLINTSSSYFFTYKKSIISAHQKQSIINNIDSIFYLLKSILEIVALIITKNYILFLIIQIICTLSENIILSVKANKMYPYLRDKATYKLSNNETKGIFSNVKSLVVYKFGSVIMSGTDNILISTLINVSTVGLCSNYTLVINAIKSITISSLNGITASVGNLNVSGNTNKKENIFYLLTFCDYLLFSFCAVAFIVLLNPFVKIWLGSNYVLNLVVPASLSLSFFIEGLRNPGYTYRITMGLFEKGKFTPYIGAITNIVLSILLCKLWGVVGIFVATSIAQLVSYSWIDPYLIHKYEFGTPVSKYFKKYIIYFITFSLITVVTLFVCSKITVSGLVGFILKGIVVLIIPNVINLLLYCKTEEFNSLKKRLMLLLNKKVKNKSNNKINYDGEIPILDKDMIASEFVNNDLFIINDNIELSSMQQISKMIREDNSIIRKIDFSLVDEDILDIILDETKIYGFKFNNDDFLRGTKYPKILSNSYKFMRYVIDMDINNIAYIDIYNVDSYNLKKIIDYTFRKIYFLQRDGNDITLDINGIFKDSDIINNDYFRECLRYIR